MSTDPLPRGPRAARGRRARTLIKWPGGKGRELDVLLPLVPATFGRYVEPFVGGGAMFFALAPRGPVHLNDANAPLMTFYRCAATRDDAFLTRLDELLVDWDALAIVTSELHARLRRRLATVREDALCLEEVERVLMRLDVRTFERDPELADMIAVSVVDKFRRVVRLEEKNDIRFGADLLRQHLETAVRAAYYTLRRDAPESVVPGVAAAEFFFVRETCYGAMFRFNAAGRFNIPYGGIAYNRKNLRGKVDYLLSEDIHRRLRDVQFTAVDFDAVFADALPSLRPDDFVFLDPPYDSEFSRYDNHAFDLEDHERLARRLASLPCRWLLVIKSTDDIERIYGSLASRPRVSSIRFEKSYTYNVRGRNDRGTVHLVLSHG